MSERLWAPWRDAYVSTPSRASDECIFCAKPRQGPEHDRENYIVLRAERVFVILNAFPYNPGHLMVVPYMHIGDLTQAEPTTLAEMMAVAQWGVRALRAAMRPNGFNLGMNLGQPAGAGIVDHIHLHVVPRWTGDTNFMPIVGDARVLPQALDSTYDVLHQAFAETSETTS